MTALNLLTPIRYTVTVVLRVSEGQLRAPERLSVGALRTHLQELTFTRARLVAMIRQHPQMFPGAAKDVEGAADDVRGRITFEIASSDLIGPGESDVPRTAHISLSFTGGNPQRTWEVTNALADMVIDSALARQRAALLREQAGAESAADSAAEQDADRSVATGSAAAELRIRTTQAAAAAARLGVRAGEEQQTLRFELVDPGRVPTLVTRLERAAGAAVTFAILLLAASLLAGAVDPRILDADDLALMGIPLVGRLPPLPPPPVPVSGPPPTEPDSAAPPGGDRGPRV